MSKLKTRLSTLTFHVVGSLRLKPARWLGTALGRLIVLLKMRLVKVTRQNLALCLPDMSDADRDALMKSSLQHTVMTGTEICVLWKHRRPPLNHYIHSIQGDDLASSLLERGKGLIVIAPHLGNWEVLPYFLTKLAPITNLYQPPEDAEIDALIRHGRSHSGGKIVPTTAKGVLALLKTLRKGEMCGILPDQNPNDSTSGEYAPFFGIPAFTMTLIHKLIQKTDCAAVFAYAKRTDKGFDIIIRRVPDDLYHADAQTSLTALNRGIESLVLECPEQYQWEYKRFKKQPGGKPNRYPR